MPAGPCLAQQRLVLDVKSHLTTSELLEFMCKAIGAREDLETLRWIGNLMTGRGIGTKKVFFARDVLAGCTMAIALISEARLLSSSLRLRSKPWRLGSLLDACMRRRTVRLLFAVGLSLPLAICPVTTRSMFITAARGKRIPF